LSIKKALEPSRRFFVIFLLPLSSCAKPIYRGQDKVRFLAKNRFNQEEENGRDRSYITDQDRPGKGPTRRAMIEGFNEPIYFGIHGGIKRFYKVEPDEEHVATHDHIGAATPA